MQQLTEDYPAAAASHQQALQLFHELGNQPGQAEVLNNLGELMTRFSATQDAHHHHTRALAIARGIGAPLEQARALEGLGRRTSKTATTAKGGTGCVRLSRFTSASGPRALRVQRNPQP